jgi:hypothetical protein
MRWTAVLAVNLFYGGRAGGEEHWWMMSIDTIQTRAAHTRIIHCLYTKRPATHLRRFSEFCTERRHSSESADPSSSKSSKTCDVMVGGL